MYIYIYNNIDKYLFIIELIPLPAELMNIITHKISSSCIIKLNVILVKYFVFLKIRLNSK